ncbi:MAG TPA: phytanoyl-CoA dioxygenase family protein [Chthonomonadales bacterium]|nr:phytanoyl-CoA dioxygenase family protein [Chthonomonadales bacterium]
MLNGIDLRYFQKNGYLLLPNLLSAGELHEARENMLRLLKQAEPAHPRVRYSLEPSEKSGGQPVCENNPRRVWMVMDTPLAGDWWYANIRDPRIVTAMTQLLGPNINFHNGKARIKPPGYTSHQVWHQDWPYERHSTSDLAAAIFYLDDTEKGASATEVLPGSHLQGEWPHDDGNAIDEDLVANFGSEPVALEASAGSVAIIHVMVVHRATENRSSLNRSAIINEYKTAEAMDLWGNQCAFADLPLARGGVPL